MDVLKSGDEHRIGVRTVFLWPQYDSQGVWACCWLMASRSSMRAYRFERFALMRAGTDREAVHDRVVIEVMRGCPNGCHFCRPGRIAFRCE